MRRFRWLPWLVAHYALNTVFCRLTVFGSVFPLFLHELGLDKQRIGLLLSFIHFCGLSALFLAPAMARFGLKRTYMVFFGLRKVITGLLLLTPWMLFRFGFDVAFIWVGAIVFGFSMCRAVGEMGALPWFQKIIPNEVRGRYAGITSTMVTVTAVIAASIAGSVIDRSSGLERYMPLFGVGVVIGLVSVCCLFFVPSARGGPDEEVRQPHLRGMLASLHDRNFTFFLAGIAPVTLVGFLGSFVPLYLREEIGFSTGSVLLLDIGALVGGFIAYYPWGRAADRHGSKPVMLAGVWLMMAQPIMLFLIPRHSSLTVFFSVFVLFLGGVSSAAWGIGSERYFFVGAVPPQKRTPYMAVYYAIYGLAAGTGPLFAGWLLDACVRLGLTGAGARMSTYTPLFAVYLAFLLAGAILLRRVRNEDSSTKAPRITVEPEPQHAS